MRVQTVLFPDEVQESSQEPTIVSSRKSEMNIDSFREARCMRICDSVTGVVNRRSSYPHCRRKRLLLPTRHEAMNDASSNTVRASVITRRKKCRECIKLIFEVRNKTRKGGR